MLVSDEEFSDESKGVDFRCEMEFLTQNSWNRLDLYGPAKSEIKMVAGMNKSIFSNSRTHSAAVSFLRGNKITKRDLNSHTRPMYLKPDLDVTRLCIVSIAIHSPNLKLLIAASVTYLNVLC